MFGYIKGPKKLEGTKQDMKLATGYNNKDKLFFMYITDKKSKITCRINMDEEYYQNFFEHGRKVFRQTKKDEVEFQDVQ